MEEVIPRCAQSTRSNISSRMGEPTKAHKTVPIIVTEVWAAHCYHKDQLPIITQTIKAAPH